jgi:hypothetical protein
MTKLTDKTRIKMPSPRFEKVYKRQEIKGLKYNEDDIVFIEEDNQLIYQKTENNLVVFKNCKEYSVANAAYACDGLLICFDESIFSLNNYIVL